MKMNDIESAVIVIWGEGGGGVNGWWKLIMSTSHFYGPCQKNNHDEPSTLTEV